MKNWKKLFQANGEGEKSHGNNTYIRKKKTHKSKAIKGDTEGYFIILKRRTYQEDINIINIYGPNIGAPKYVREI